MNLNLLAATCIYYGFNERSVKLLRSYSKERVSHNKVLKLGMEILAPFIWDRGVPQGRILRPVLNSMLYVWFSQLSVPWLDWEVFAYSEVCCWFNWTNLQFMWSPLFSVVYDCNPVYGDSILNEFAQIIQKIKNDTIRCVFSYSWYEHTLLIVLIFLISLLVW